MRTPDRSWFGFALSICLVTSLVGCEPGDLPAPPTSESESAATAASQNYLVSFVGGTIPSNAASIVGTANKILARYANIGIVLVQSSDSGFAANLRGNSAVDSVGAAKSISSALEKGRGVDFTKTPPAAHVHQFKAPGSDPLSYRQWDMDQIHSPQARAINAGSSSVLVGLLDSGIDITHPDLVGQVNTAASASCIGGIANTDPAIWANDLIGHGTHVAGTVAAKKNNVGIVGVAPGVKVAAVKVAIDDINDPNFGLVFADAMVCAIDWAVGHNFDLMNASLTIDPFTGPIDDIFCGNDPDRAGVITMVRRAVLKAASKNVSLVASAGNFFMDISNINDNPTCKVLPVGLPTVIGVSAVGYTKLLSNYSDYGAKGTVDVTSPGGDNLIPDPLVMDTSASGQVLSSVPPGSYYYAWSAGWDGQFQDCSSGTCITYAYLQGTSQAAPHVTGVAALAISRYGKMGPVALGAILRRNATPLSCPPSPYDPNTGMYGETPATCTSTVLGTNFYGAGEIDALNVVK
jgi:subtilisin family serine protease